MISLRRQNRFAVEDPEQLRRQLADLESALEDALRQLERQTFTRGKRYDVRSGDVVTALVGCMYVCDTTDGSITLRLEKPRPEHENSFIHVWKASGSNNLVLAPIDAEIDDADSVTLTSAAHYDISTDGRNYRKEF